MPIPSELCSECGENSARGLVGEQKSMRRVPLCERCYRAALTQAFGHLWTGYDPRRAKERDDG